MEREEDYEDDANVDFETLIWLANLTFCSDCSKWKEIEVRLGKSLESAKRAYLKIKNGRETKKF